MQTSITRNKPKRATPALLASLVDLADDAILAEDLDGKVISWNRGAVQLLGYSPDEVVGHSATTLATPEHRTAIADAIARLRRGEVVRPFDAQLLRKDGQPVPVSLGLSAIHVDEAFVGVSAIARDITARLRADKQTRAASQYARSLIEASLDPLVTISPEGKITDVNEATIKVTGTDRNRLIGTDFSDYFVDPDMAREGYQQVFAQGYVTNFPLTIRDIGGRLTDVLYNASVYKDSHGKVQGVFAAARDVSAQNAASQYARSLIEASLDPLVTISPEGKITDVNDASAQVTGVGREELIGTDFSDYFVEPDKAREGYQRVFSQGSVTDYPLTIRHKNGRLTDVLYNASVYRDTTGKVLGVFAAARDITAQKQASGYARSLIEASLDPLVTISPEGKITDVNEASAQVTGLPREKLIGTDFSDYFTEPDRAREGYQRVFEVGSVSDYPLTIRHKDGRLTEVLYNASVYKDARGNVLGVFAAARDVTVQQQASGYARSLIEASLDPLVTISAEGKITDVNEATIRATGVAREKLIATDFSDYFAEPDKARAGYQQVFAEGSVTDYPLTIRHKNNSLMDVLYNASIYKDARGKVQGVFAAARDVTAQRQASQYARSLIEASLDPLVTISTEGKITDVNEASAIVTGVSRDRLIGTDFSDYFTEPQSARDGYQRVFSQGSVTDYPLTIRHRDGRLTRVLYNASVYKNVSGQVLGVFAAARDVNAQKQAEEEVAVQRAKELERLAELERFQKLTVGRELKMIELKKEIATLQKQVDGPKPAR